MSISQVLQNIGSLGSGTATSLKEAFDLNRLMILDFTAFIGVPLAPITDKKPKQQYLFPARGLFVVDANGDLRAVAVQCGDQEKSDSKTSTPWYTPPVPEKRKWAAGSDNDKAAMTEWAMARSCVLGADSSYFETITHLGMTHLVMEAFAVASPRTLPEEHQVRKLMDSHMEGTIFINNFATTTLVAPSGVVSTSFPPPISVTTSVAVQHALKVRRDMTANLFPKTVEALNLPSDMHSPFIEDAFLYWDAISEWMGAFVKAQYADDAAVAGDKDLQNWVADLKVGEGKVKAHTR